MGLQDLRPVHLRHGILVIFSHPSRRVVPRPPSNSSVPYKIPSPLRLPRYSTRRTIHFAITFLPVFLRNVLRVPRTQVNICQDPQTICVLWLLALVVVSQPPNRTVHGVVYFVFTFFGWASTFCMFKIASHVSFPCI